MKRKSLLIAGPALVIMVLAFAFISFKPALQGTGGYATMTIYENFSIVNSKIIINYPDNETEIVELGPFKYNNDYLTDNCSTINQTLNKLREKGFRIVSSSSNGKINSNKAMKITTIFLEKE